MALRSVITNMEGIKRFGSASIPMDDSLATIAVDAAGRSYLVFNTTIASGVDGIDASLVKHFIQSLASHAMLTIHVNAYGTDDHHTIEAIFKALGVALNDALQSQRACEAQRGFYRLSCATGLLNTVAAASFRGDQVKRPQRHPCSQNLEKR